MARTPLARVTRPDLAREAHGVLDRNWTGSYTRPGLHLYPHQWSWDAAFVAIGRAGHDPDRARQELRSLLGGQWRTGLLPHIVFAPDVPPSAYYPGPIAWRTERSPDAPAAPRTSGVVQPPLHATAALIVDRAAPDRAFLDDLYPRLAAWHDYLYRERDVDGDGLVAIRHPWESGQDNSPVWDGALAAVAVTPGRVAPGERSDLDVVPDGERPTLDDYGAYMELVDLFARCEYDEPAIREACPFLVSEPLFNALLARAEEDLAQIAGRLGGDPEPHRARARRTARAMNERLWDEDRGLYVAWDHVAGAPVPACAAAGLVPLFAGVPELARARRLATTAASPSFWPDGGHPLCSFDRRAPEFSPSRYWRGPVWANVDWLVLRGMQRYGLHAEAGALRADLLALVEAAGFREYYDPLTGAGRGARDFAWTAALTLDLLADPS